MHAMDFLFLFNDSYKHRKLWANCAIDKFGIRVF